VRLNPCSDKMAFIHNFELMYGFSNNVKIEFPTCKYAHDTIIVKKMSVKRKMIASHWPTRVIGSGG
jgi:hypothetical protein